MSQELRQRATAGDNQSKTKEREMTDTLITRSGLSPSQMLKSGSPIHNGSVWKLHIPVFYLLAPAWLKRSLSYCWFCPRSFAPQWKKRYLIAVGKYVYRFASDESSDPKGVPLSLREVSANIISLTEKQEDDMEIVLDPSNHPAGSSAVFRVSVYGKTQYYAVSDREEAMTWVNSIHQARQESITRIMGHADKSSYPKAWDYFDRLGDDYIKRKQTIKNRLEEANKRELELTSMLSNNNVPNPRGIYG